MYNDKDSLTQVLHARGVTSLWTGLAEADEERKRGDPRRARAQGQSGPPASLTRMSVACARADGRARTQLVQRLRGGMLF